MSKPEYTCPNCGGHEFKLTVTQLVEVEFQPDDEHEITDGPRGDTEWGADTNAICCDMVCGWSDQLGFAQTPDNDEEPYPEEVLNLDVSSYTEAQLQAAIRCADWVATAYARADGENGGGQSVSWDTVDYAYQAAREAFSEAQLATIDRDAKAANGSN